MAGMGREPDRHRELVSALYSLITGRLEDAAALAADGQNEKTSPDKLADLTRQIASSTGEVTILLRAITVILATD